MTEPWGASTNPSSENSSIERMQQPPKPDLGEAYGFNGFGGGPQFSGTILEEYGHGDPAYGEQGYGPPRTLNGNGQPFAGNTPPPPPHHGAPPPPPKDAKPSRMPVRSSAGTNNSIRKNFNPSPAAASAGQEKRRSWIKKRFSRS